MPNPQAMQMPVQQIMQQRPREAEAAAAHFSHWSLLSDWPRLRAPLWLGLTVLVLSILTTKQHYVAIYSPVLRQRSWDRRSAACRVKECAPCLASQAWPCATSSATRGARDHPRFAVTGRARAVFMKGMNNGSRS